MNFESIKDQKFNSLTKEELSQISGGRMASYTVNLTYKDVTNDADESDRSSDAD